ncbi:MAG: DUF2017 family protein [Acidimicrobiales bacterium]
MSVFSPRFRPGDGGLQVKLRTDEQEIIAYLVGQLRELLMADQDPNLVRLKPPARRDDPEADAEYREMVGDDLLRHRLEAIDTVEVGLAGGVIDDEAVTAWLQTLNALRLVLGERLEADDDPLGDEADAYALYEWLGWLLEQLVRAAATDLPSASDPDACS